MKTTEQKICELCGITEEQYAATKEQFGYEYARAFSGGHEDTVRWLTHGKMYWAWYKNQWELIDVAFAKAYKSADVRDADICASLRGMWLAEHQPAAMKAIPGRMVIKELRLSMQMEQMAQQRMVDSFERMVDSVIKEVTGMEVAK